MQSHRKDQNASRLRSRASWLTLTILSILAIGAGTQRAMTAAVTAPATQGDAPVLEVEYGEFLAKPEELASIPANDIARSLRLNAQAMKLGKQVYDRNCAGCHGADLKGSLAQHTPDLTDNVWRWSGDDLESGGIIKYASDVEWTVRYGIRANHENTRGADVDMLAFDPQYRNARDTMDFGSTRYLNDAEIRDVAEFVLQLSGQQHNAAMATRGRVLFEDNAKGNCQDCHGDDATGIPAFGSTDLTRKELYLWGADRATILESINRGRIGMMPAFEGRLKPEEIKSVSIFVLFHARKEAPPPQQ